MKDPWITNTPDLLPDFIIGGAMKSGTTTLHAMLNNHPDVSLARDELGFFDMDDLKVHADFNLFNPKTCNWTVQDLTQDPELFWNWYHSKFVNLKGKVIGEDSTTYLASKWAAERLAKQKKNIKLIFILRHPTKRTISNYLHALKSGRAHYSLEKTLSYNPRSILDRSLYKEQLSFYYKCFDSASIKVVLFEDLVENPKACLKDLCVFLKLDSTKLKDEDFEIHSNKTKLPKYKGLQLFRNRLLMSFGSKRYSKFLPIVLESASKPSIFERSVNKIHKWINPMNEKYTYKPNESTIELLDNFYKQELNGIDELIGFKVYERWFKNNI